MAKDGLDGFFLNCQLDEKFELIEAEFGLKGFAILIKLLQRIYGEHGYYCEYNSDISLLLAAKWNIHGTSSGGDADSPHRQLPAADETSAGGCHNLIDLVVAASVRRGIFDKTMYEKYGILTSVGIQKRYISATRKRINVVLKNEYLLINYAENGKTDGRNEKTDGRNGKTDVRFEQSKVKESKVKESKRSNEDAHTPSFNAEQAWIDTFALYPKKSSAVMARQVWMDKLLDVIEPNRKDVAKLIYHATKMYLDDYDKNNPDDESHRYIPKYSDWLVNDCDYWISEVEKKQRSDDS